MKFLDLRNLLLHRMMIYRMHQSEMMNLLQMVRKILFRLQVWEHRSRNTKKGKREVKLVLQRKNRRLRFIKFDSFYLQFGLGDFYALARETEFIEFY